MSHYHTPNLPQTDAPVDIYRRIHKALRYCMSDTLARVSRLDIGDRGEVIAVLAQVREMAVLCATHVAHEDTFVHPAMEARFPGTAKATAPSMRITSTPAARSSRWATPSTTPGKKTARRW